MKFLSALIDNGQRWCRLLLRRRRLRVVLPPLGPQQDELDPDDPCWPELDIDKIDIQALDTCVGTLHVFPHGFSSRCQCGAVDRKKPGG